MAKIQIRRGTKAQLNSILGTTPLSAGELGFTTDTHEVYCGDGTAHHLIGGVTVDTFANRPSAGVSGRIFHATDTDQTFVDDGAVWVDVSSGIGSLDDVADGTTYARAKVGALDNGYVVQLTDNAGANPLTRIALSNHIGDTTKHFIIDDTDVQTNETWSSSKIQDEIATVVSGIDPQESVISQLNLVTSEPATPTTGDRYINTATGNSSESTTAVLINNIYEWNGTSWVETTVSEGMHTWDETQDAAYVFNSSAWVKFGSTVTHDNLSGLDAGDYHHLTADQYNNTTPSIPGLHEEEHTIASHTDTTATGAELETLTDGSSTTLHVHPLTAHAIADHNDTTATGTELETLTNGSNADALHVHTASAITNFNASVLGQLSVADTTSIDMTLTAGQFSADLLLADGGTFV